MYRQLITQLLEWKNSAARMPAMLDGARQVGKSYLLEHKFGKEYFDNVFKINFEDTKDAAELFENCIRADKIIERISVFLGKDFNPKSDLLFFDEIGLCEQALNSLKYFKEQRPDVYLCASGSNIGLIERYPVGQTHELTLHPMTFYEFVCASENAPLIRIFEEQQRDDVAHKLLQRMYREYLFVGGMPAVVKRWYSSKAAIVSKTQQVRKLQNDLITGYVRDFGKYNPRNKMLATQLESVFRNIPKQLSTSVDTSVKRFRFNNIIPGKARYRDFQTLIDYLLSTNLISEARIIDGAPNELLTSMEQQGRFKLFIHDVGLLHAMAGVPYPRIIDQSYGYKGYMAENFAQNEFRAAGFDFTYAWQSGNKAELEFILPNALGDIVPIEIKSGKHTKAKSLTQYMSQYAPTVAYKLCDLVGGFREGVVHTRPLYYARFAADSIANSWDVDEYF